MIPVNDNNPTRRIPLMVWVIILINCICFWHQIHLDDNQLMRFIYSWGMIPANYSPEKFQPTLDLILPTVTCMFLHGGLLHIGSNLLFLYVFGDNIEDRMGHESFFLFYVLCGVAASACHVWMNPDSTVPIIGASGAISGILGAYLMWFPRVRLSVILLVFPWPFQVPAFVFLGGWFIMQYFQSQAQANSDGSGVAWWAHIGGFVAGMVLCWFFAKPKKAAKAASE